MRAIAAARIGLLVAIGIIVPSAVLAQKAPITRAMVLQDRDGPMAGNPKGDVTIVAFLDYNCPYCKRSDPDLERLVKTDGKIRLIYKDWPILSPASTHGAELALAARYQGKYEIVHDALMRIPGSHIDNATMDRTLRMSGVDIDLLNLDLKRHSKEIHALLRHNNEQARALGLKGVPAFFIGPFDEPAALDYSGFKKVVADVRMLQGK
ncbi:MAG: DsbA family protein [Methylovirgula sp.]